MTTQLAPSPVFKAFDNNGNPLFNGQLFSYVAGTTTPQSTYTDSTGATPNTNPVILNSRGECNLWLDPNLAYKLILEDSNGNLIWTVDNIQSSLVQIPYGNASGTNTIAVNTTPAFSTLTDGLLVFVKIANTITAAPTLNVNSTGALNIYESDGSTQLGSGELIANNIYGFIYNSSLNSSSGGWSCINPSYVTELTIFTANGNFTPRSTGNYYIQAIGGGGGGGGGSGSTTTLGGQGGQGGSGGVLGFTTVSLTAGTSYAVVIGTGGSAGSAGATSGNGGAGGNGNDTTFNGSTVAAGGSGGNLGRASQLGGASGSGGTNGGGNGGGAGGNPVAGTNTPGNAGTAAAANTGGGGGGGGGGGTAGTAQVGGAGAAGGKGILIIRRA